MAVPTTGRLNLIKLAREAKYADYFGTQNMGTVYQMMLLILVLRD